MTPEQIAHTREWIAALRSGKYVQARTRLRIFQNFCCLGVGCDLIPEGEWVEEIPGIQCFRIEGNNYGTYLPEVVRLYYGLPIAIDRRLAFMNDKDGKSFIQIAQVLEDLIKAAEAGQDINSVNCVIEGL